MKKELSFLKARCAQAEKEAAEWKQRFDILLSKTPNLT